MRALVLHDGRATLREDHPEPRPAPGECRVAVTLAGVCATDLALLRGYMRTEAHDRGPDDAADPTRAEGAAAVAPQALVPGHEFVGIALDGPLSGRRVVGEINAGCGSCARCRAGDPRHCPGRTVLGIFGRDGAFAERLVLPQRNLLEVPRGVPDEAAVLAEPLAAALAVCDALPAVVGQRILVAGDGKLGLLITLALASAGARVTLAGRHPERQALLPAGVPLITGLLEADVIAGAEPQSEHDRFDAAVEATGQAAVLPRLLARVRPQGTLVLKTTSERDTSLSLSALVVHEQRLVGSRCGRLAPALQALADGRISVDGLIAAQRPLAQAEQALQLAASGGQLKLLIRPEA